MKILIPNAKELNTNLESQSFQGLTRASQEILTVISQMKLEDLADFYKLKLDKAQLELDRWQRMAMGRPGSILPGNFMMVSCTVT